VTVQLNKSGLYHSLSKMELFWFCRSFLMMIIQLMQKNHAKKLSFNLDEEAKQKIIIIR